MTSSLWTLISIGLVQMLAVISPGPSFLITARTAVSKSRLDGVKIALGLGAGTVIWSSAALLGLNVLFHAFPPLLVAMKIFGALFLLWIAYKIFIHAAEPLDMGEGQDTGGSPFLKGFLVQISNPKVVVFFGSIFVAMLPAQVPAWMAVALIAMVSLNEVWWYSLVALFFGAGPVRSFYLKAKAWIDRFTGAFLGVLGIKLLWGAIRG
ncbi:LysE family translocator [Aestuariivirga litoralis]|uniref:LysE family translocator n=1 Tax=Aestuariivirga litoralis TaxID=2650924 RepID=UPI001FED4978|nr:LysE family transporter [Aestuariivirga litoralis]MBG1231370.1 LysE family translocator [Aestuariivirga litoralis]